MACKNKKFTIFYSRHASEAVACKNKKFTIFYSERGPFSIHPINLTYYFANMDNISLEPLDNLQIRIGSVLFS